MSQVTSVAETTVNWAKQRQIPVLFTAQTGSTNDDAKTQALSESDELVLYVTEHQTAGRGRGANTWLDTGSGEGLLSTWSFHVPSVPQSITAPRIGLSLFNAANGVWPSLEWSLKAPNDLFLNGRKVGGLLVESISSGPRHRLMIGLGLNILNHPRRFSEAEHLNKTLQNALSEGEWFQFLDELHRELNAGLQECLQPALNPAACRALADALNANSARPFSVQRVSAQGDLVHSQGQVQWTDL